MNENNAPAPIVELQASQLELVVNEKNIGSLATNAKQIRELVKTALPKYDIANYSADDVAKAKADKALLNKAAKSLNDKRIEFEKEFMAPFGEFKGIVAETVTLIKEAVGKIDTVIKADEERSKNMKREAVEKTADSLGWGDVGIPLQKIWSDKWLNKSTSMKSIETEIRAKMESIAADIETLKSFTEDFDVLVVRYKENLNLQETVRYANQLKEQREAKAKEGQSMAPAQSSAPSDAQGVAHETKNEAPANSGSHGIDNAERDAADAFADVLGQASETAKQEVAVPLTRRYEIVATEEALAALETYMTQHDLGFTII